jgi:hypothetical protein
MARSPVSQVAWMRFLQTRVVNSAWVSRLAGQIAIYHRAHKNLQRLSVFFQQDAGANSVQTLPVILIYPRISYQVQILLVILTIPS